MLQSLAAFCGSRPARSAMRLKVIGGTIEQAMISLGIKAVMTAFKVTAWAGGLGTPKVGFRLAYDVARDPMAFTDWLIRVLLRYHRIGARGAWGASFGGDLGTPAHAPPRCAYRQIRVPDRSCRGRYRE